VFLEWLRRDGTDWSKHPTREDATRDVTQVWTLLAVGKSKTSWTCPLITDPEVLDNTGRLLGCRYGRLLPSIEQPLHHSLSARLVKPPGKVLEIQATVTRRVTLCWFGFLAVPRLATFFFFLVFFFFFFFFFFLLETDIGSANLGSDWSGNGADSLSARTYLSVGALVMPWTKTTRPAVRTWCAGVSTPFTGRANWRLRVTASPHRSRLSLAVGAPLAEPKRSNERAGLFPARPTKCLNGVLTRSLGMTGRCADSPANLSGGWDHERIRRNVILRLHLASNRNLGFLSSASIGPQLQHDFLRDHIVCR